MYDNYKGRMSTLFTEGVILCRPFMVSTLSLGPSDLGLRLKN